MAARHHTEPVNPVTPAPDTGEPATPLSIQGEREVRRGHTLWASDADVALRAQNSEDGVLACRERGRHAFPATRLTLAGGQPFTDITDDGFYVRRIACPCCAHVNPDGSPGLPRVVREEIWDLKHQRGVIIENGAQLASARTIYLDDDYLSPHGSGRTRPRQWRQVALGPSVAGLRIRDLRQQIIDARDERDRLTTQAYQRRRDDAAREVSQLRVIDGHAEKTPVSNG